MIVLEILIKILVSYRLVNVISTSVGVAYLICIVIAIESLRQLICYMHWKTPDSIAIAIHINTRHQLKLKLHLLICRYYQNIFPWQLLSLWAYNTEATYNIMLYALENYWAHKDNNCHGNTDNIKVNYRWSHAIILQFTITGYCRGYNKIMQTNLISIVAKRIMLMCSLRVNTLLYIPVLF